ncbi:GNAT family N-acetyltransferase [Luteimonas sp. A277]
MKLTLRPATDSDFAFCESLSCANMAVYHRSRGIDWDKQRFQASWLEFENLMVLADGEVVGLLRVLPEGEALAIRDLQLLPAWQGRGIGRWAVEQAKALAAERGFHRLVLRVYTDNPARNLYLRLGFVVEDLVNGTLHMSCLLARNDAG